VYDVVLYCARQKLAGEADQSMRSRYAVLVVLVAVALFVLVNYHKEQPQPQPQPADNDNTSTTTQQPQLTSSTQRLAIRSSSDTQAGYNT